MKLRLGLSLACVLLSGAAAAREPHELGVIERETRIAANVFESALRSEWQGELRVSSVSADYLADQGVVFSVRVSKPWISIREDGRNRIDIDGGQISIPEIPRIVEDILDKLDIEIEPFEPEALEDLRALRAEQRELRLEQRDIRSSLRVKRRELVRADEELERDVVKIEISELERELAAVDAQYEALRDDIEAQMELIGELSRRQETSAPNESAPDMAATVAKVVCDYGATLKSLDDDDEHISFVIREGDESSYFVFKADHVTDCSDDNMKPERLLELGYQY